MIPRKQPCSSGVEPWLSSRDCAQPEAISSNPATSLQSQRFISHASLLGLQSSCYFGLNFYATTAYQTC